MLVTLFLSILTIALAIYAWALRAEPRDFRREHHIRSYVFPATMLSSLVETYPQLQEKDTQLVARALRQFFLVHARSPKSVVGMPAKVVDELWHKFILDTQAYAAFCHSAFGAFFHHIPASEMSGDSNSATALRRTWRLACLEENINPVHPTRLPLLFAIDSKLAVPGASVYALDTFTRKGSDGGGSAGCGGGTGGDCGCGGSGCGGSGCGGGCGGD